MCMRSISRARPHVFFLKLIRLPMYSLNLPDYRIFLVWLTLRAIAVCSLMFFVFITFTFCSVSIKLNWVSVDCQRYLKLNGVIQYLIWIFLPQFSHLDGDLLVDDASKFKQRLKIIQSGQGTVGWWLGEMLIKKNPQKQDFNPFLCSACHLKLLLFPPCTHTPNPCSQHSRYIQTYYRVRSHWISIVSS